MIGHLSAFEEAILFLLYGIGGSGLYAAHIFGDTFMLYYGLKVIHIGRKVPYWI